MSNNLPNVQPKAGIVLPAKVYDALKPVVQIVLPATATLYAGLAVYWGFPLVTQIVGTITLVTTFLGIVLGLSSRTYNSSDARYDGTLNVMESDTSQIHQLEITTPPEDLEKQSEMILKVNKVTPITPVDSPPRS